MRAMEKLLAYINSLDREARDDFCARVRTSEGYIRKSCSAQARLHPSLCVRIERESGQKVTRKALRPEDWRDIWPELHRVAA